MLERYVDESFVYRFTQGPDVVKSIDDAITDGLNCVSLAHLVLKDMFGYELPQSLQLAEAFMDRAHFSEVNCLNEIQQGDLVWFGIENPPIIPEEFVPIYHEGQLLNWRDFPVKHVAINTGSFDDHNDPLLLHATHVEKTNTIWPFRKFAEYQNYRNFYGVTRLNVARIR